MLKKIIILIISIIMIMTFITSNNVVYAESSDMSDGSGSSSSASSGSSGSLGSGFPSDLSQYKPSLADSSGWISIVESILGVLQVIGLIGCVILLALFGFNTILGSASEKAVAHEKYGGFLIGIILVTGGISIAKIVISVAEGF